MKAIHLYILSLTLVILSCSDKVKSEYTTYKEAESKGVFKRGWLPEIIPKSSANIVTVNDLDLNLSEGEFVYSNTDKSEFLSHLKRVSELDTKHYEAYTYKNWTFFLHSENPHCKYSFSLRGKKQTEQVVAPDA